MATIPELLDGHVTLEVECLDRLYLNGYIGKLATGPGLVFFMREQLGKPVASPVVLGQISEKFREAVKALAEREEIPVYQFRHKERKDDIANEFRRQRQVRDEIVFIGVAQEKAQAFNGRKINGQFQFDRDKTVYVNHYYFYIDDKEFGPLFLKVCSYAPWSIKLCLNGHEWAKRQLDKYGIRLRRWTTGSCLVRSRPGCRRSATGSGRRISIGCSGNGCAASRSHCGRKTGCWANDWEWRSGWLNV